MLGTVRTILNQLSSTSVVGNADAWPGRHTGVSEDNVTSDRHSIDGADGASSSNLYRCPSCERVYVAIEKDSCATCETAVTRVEQTD